MSLSESGLGFGFTLRAALAHAPLSVKVVVAELMEPVIEWNKNPAYRLAHVPMSDRRVSVLQKDVADVIRQRPQGFDAILMDVDNGPRALSTDQNSFLYQPVGLAQIFKAIRSGGCVGFWSATEDPTFAKAMKKVGFEVEIQKCRAHPTSGGMHTLFFGFVKEIKPQKKTKKTMSPGGVNQD